MVIIESTINSNRLSFQARNSLSSLFSQVCVIVGLILNTIFLYTPTVCNGEIAPLEIYEVISKGQPLKIGKSKATFYDGNSEWTIFGAIQKKGSTHQVPLKWSLDYKPFEIQVINSPISNSIVLPHTDPIPNVNKGGAVAIKACPGEYKSASFVIRSGNYPIENVVIKASDLKSTNNKHQIASYNIDIRGVKCWYQSGPDVKRSKTDEKRLTPELLLHNLDLVRVNHTHQVNLVRNLNKIQDANTLLPFFIPAKSNQQIWLTFVTPKDTPPGKFHGILSTNFNIQGKPYHANLMLDIEILPYSLEDVPIEYALFYLSFYEPMQKKMISRNRNIEQMLAEFKDMREHGLTNVAISHLFTFSKDGNSDYSKLEPVIQLFREAGFKTKRFLYVDWKLSGWDNPIMYNKKISQLKQLTSKYEFDELLVYNKDEQRYEDLIKYKNTFEITHQLGAKNFVATDRSTAFLMRGLIDYAILPRSTPVNDLNEEDSNLVINGDMTISLGHSSSGWRSSNINLLFVKNNKLIKKTGEYVYFAQNIPIKEGTMYVLEYNILKFSNSFSGIGLYLAAGGGSCVDNDIYLPTTSGNHRIFFHANKNRALRFGASSTAKFELTNISVREANRNISEIKSAITPWAYNDPQAGLEQPGMYLLSYGDKLLDDGYQGVCNFAYQSGGCWDDWIDQKWRPHCMTYPSTTTPISTIQWEGWREAINSVRHAVSNK